MWDITKASYPSQRTVIEAHDHNIPCIKFSPCGKKKNKEILFIILGNFLASTSIDSKVFLWEFFYKKHIVGENILQKNWARNLCLPIRRMVF